MNKFEIINKKILFSQFKLNLRYNLNIISNISTSVPSSTSNSSSNSYFNKINKKIDILFIRHAESTNNILHSTPQTDINWRNKRKADCDLSLKGQEQIQLLNKYVQNQLFFNLIKSKPIFYTSPMKRCLDTSYSIVSAIPNTIVHVQPKMYEFGGCYHMDGEKVITATGMNKNQIESNYPGYICPEGNFNLFLIILF